MTEFPRGRSGAPGCGWPNSGSAAPNSAAVRSCRDVPAAVRWRSAQLKKDGRAV